MEPSILTKTCPACKRSYPFKGKQIVCICTKKPIILGTTDPPQGKCIHLGQLEGKIDCRCSYTTPVYTCAIHGVCCERPTAYKAYINLDGEHIKGDIPVCRTCPEKSLGQDN